MSGVAPDQLELDGARLPSLVIDFPGRVDFDVTLPAHPELTFSYAVESGSRAPRARVEFAVSVIHDRFAVPLFRRTLRMDDQNRWHRARLDLAAWAGGKVTLRLENRPERNLNDVPWADRIRVSWGDPRIASGAPPQAPSSPSVILIVVDTLRYDTLGVNGFDGPVSPSLDWLALESVRFDRAFAAAPWTKPSIASLLTGLSPLSHGVLEKNGITPGATGTLSEQAVTLAEVLSGQGFETVAFISNSWLAADFGYAQGFDRYSIEANDGVVIERARELLTLRDPATPFFLYLHFLGPHAPYVAPERDYLELKTSSSLGKDRPITAADPGRPRHLDATPWANREENARLVSWRAKYAAAVRRLDRQIGALLDELRSSGRLDRSWVVLTSDHGEEFLEHGSWEHGHSLCDHQLHVPLWIRKPGAASAGRRISELVSLEDVMPTVLSLLSLPIPPVVQGRDRSPWLADDDPLPEAPGKALLASGVVNEPGLLSLRTDRLHLIWDEDSGRIELYDTVEDPEETENQAKESRDEVGDLKRLLAGHLARISSQGRLDGERVPIPDRLRDQLRALGYIQ
ncbi:MAG TPA: sulfatase [Vicinamibacteria bacterium]|nr:sulfatase [Vicinamibacteria bacterium]